MAKREKLTQTEAKILSKIRYRKNKIHDLTHTKKGTKRKRLDSYEIAKTVNELEELQDALDSFRNKRRAAKEKREKKKEQSKPLPVEFEIHFTNFELEKCVKYVLYSEIKSYQDKNGEPCNYHRGCKTIITRPKKRVTEFLGVSVEKNADQVLIMINQIFSVFFSDEKDKSILFGTVILFQRDTEIIGYEIITDNEEEM